VEVWRYSDGVRNETPYVRGERHGTMRWWHADGSRECEIPYVNGKAHGTATCWYADGSREREISYVDGTWWRADGIVGDVKEWVHGVRRE
jgi:antitoxin component YwqK of YwqJK toxin-antitoxin module